LGDYKHSYNRSIRKDDKNLKEKQLENLKQTKISKYTDQELKKKNPRVFFSFDWDNIWRANQIIYQSKINVDPKARFVNTSLLGKSNAENEEYIKRKIRSGIDKAGTVVILNSNTYDDRKYTVYEMEYAIKRNKKMLVINTNQLTNRKGSRSNIPPIPKLCKEREIPIVEYIPGKSNLKRLVLENAKKPK
jgi:hypothetical protein